VVLVVAAIIDWAPSAAALDQIQASRDVSAPVKRIFEKLRQEILLHSSS
jgi:hypothetical protein